MPYYTRCHARYWRFTEETGGKGEKSETGGTGEGSKFKVFGTSNPELLIAPVTLGVPVERLRALADLFRSLLEADL
ncbi:MAG: hypothetical protein EWM73_00620 [Nitrospira sp.]|nr:MAG: hypothetical protein EWM73_00620 [Nitrospira sp.]